MEGIGYYLVMIGFAAVAIIFFVYPIKCGFKASETIFYMAIGTFFGAIAVGMLTKNGVLVEALLCILMGSGTLMAGLNTLKDVFVHRIPVEGQLKAIHTVRGYRGGAHDEMDFYVPEKNADYTIEYISSARKFTVGETYKIYIGEKGKTAFIHHIRWFFFGVFVSGFGLLWFGLLMELLKK